MVGLHAKPIQKTAVLILYSITDAGRKKIEEALPDHIKNIQRLMQVFNSNEQAELQELLKKFKNIA